MSKIEQYEERRSHTLAASDVAQSRMAEKEIFVLVADAEARRNRLRMEQRTIFMVDIDDNEFRWVAFIMSDDQFEAANSVL